MLGYLTTDIICSEKQTIRECSSRKTELRGIDNVQGQICEHIFAPNGGYCVYYPCNLFCNTHGLENWAIFLDILSAQDLCAYQDYSDDLFGDAVLNTFML